MFSTPVIARTGDPGPRRPLGVSGLLGLLAAASKLCSKRGMVVRSQGPAAVPRWLAGVLPAVGCQ